jgi:hypothetical protein
MKILVLLTPVLILCTLPAVAQGHGWPTPPQPAVAVQQPIGSAGHVAKTRIDGLQLQREARELSDLANSLPLDMDHVSHGILPKDVIDKLKRIEKLSKHLRGEIAP